MILKRHLQGKELWRKSFEKSAELPLLVGVGSPGAEEPETQRGGKYGRQLQEAVWYEGHLPHHLKARILHLIM